MNMIDIRPSKEMTDHKVWERGKLYYKEGAVNHLEEDSDGHWEAIVTGNDDYEVMVEIQFDHVQEWDCNCPYEGSICKHVVATVLAIKDEREAASKDVQGNSTKTKNFEQLLDSVSANELRQFLKKHASESKSYNQAFQVYFVDKNLAAGKEHYVQLIAKSLQSEMDRHGFIDYYHAPKAFRTVFSLLDKAENLKNSQNYNEIWLITSSIVEEVSKVMEYMDDSDGMITDSYDRAYYLIDFLIMEDDVPMSLKAQMMDWHITEFNNTEYQYYGDDHILDSLIDLAEITGRIDEVLTLLDVKIKRADRDYALTILLQKKAQLLKLLGRLAEYVSLVHENMELPAFRQLKVDELVEQKRWDEAIVLIMEGIQISDKLSHLGTTIQWERQLLDIYKKSGKPDKYLVLLRKLFYKSNSQYYPILKATVGNEKWPEERAQIITNLKKKRREWYFLYELYAAEQMFPELIQLISQHPEFRLIKTYEPLLFNIFPVEIINLYKHVCEQFAAKANNRSNYQELAMMLKHIMKLDGGRPVVTHLVTTFREIYKRRSAMMDELRNLD